MPGSLLIVCNHSIAKQCLLSQAGTGRYFGSFTSVIPYHQTVQGMQPLWKYSLCYYRHTLALFSLTFLIFFNLTEQRINAEVNTLFKRVAHLFSMQVITGQGNIDRSFFIFGSFRFYNLQYKFNLNYVFASSFEFCSFLFNKCIQFFCGIEVDGLNLEFHKYLLFL